MKLLIISLFFSTQLFAQADFSTCYEVFIPRNLVSPSLVNESRWVYNGHNNERLRPSQLAYTSLTPLHGRKIQDIEDILKHAEIIDKKYIDPGQNLTFLLTFKDGTKGVWKPHREVWGSNYRAEVLAYEFDQKIKIKIVPATVERTIDGKKGSIQLFRESNDSLKLPQSELDKQSFFDFLIDHRDRHQMNYLASPEGDRVISIDNGHSFTGLGHQKKSFFKRREAITRFLKSEEGQQVMRELKGLQLENFELEVNAYLGREDANKFIKRIKFAIKFFDQHLR